MMRWRRSRHVVRLALRASLAGSIRGGRIVVTIRAAGTLGLLTFRELLMCLREKEESIGSCVGVGRIIGGVIGGIGVPCVRALR